MWLFTGTAPASVLNHGEKRLVPRPHATTVYPVHQGSRLLPKETRSASHTAEAEITLWPE